MNVAVFLSRALLALCALYALCLGAPGALRVARGLLVNDDARRGVNCAALILWAVAAAAGTALGLLRTEWLPAVALAAALLLLRTAWAARPDWQLCAPRFGALLREGVRPALAALLGGAPCAALCVFYDAALLPGAACAVLLLLLARIPGARDAASAERRLGALTLLAAVLCIALCSLTPGIALMVAWALGWALLLGAPRVRWDDLLRAVAPLLAAGLIQLYAGLYGAPLAAALCALSPVLTRRALYAAWLPLRAEIIRRRAQGTRRR